MIFFKIIILKIKMSKIITVNEFQKHQHNFELQWCAGLNLESLPPNQRGCVGRYGPCYGTEEYSRDINNKYGINEGKGLPSSTIELRFSVKNKEGLDYIFSLLNELKITNYQENIPKYTKIGVKPGFEKQLEEINNYNNPIIAENLDTEQKAHLLIGQLREFANFNNISIKQKSLKDTDFCYEYGYAFPLNFTVETDNFEQSKLLFDSQILHKC